MVAAVTGLVMKLRRGDRVTINDADFAVLKPSALLIEKKSDIRVVDKDGVVRVDKNGTAE